MATMTEVPVIKTITPDDRWELDVPHDERSESLYRFIADYDYKFGLDALRLKAGGDGDNGEHLMYILDEYFASRDASHVDQEELYKAWHAGFCRGEVSGAREFPLDSYSENPFKM